MMIIFSFLDNSISSDLGTMDTLDDDTQDDKNANAIMKYLFIKNYYTAYGLALKKAMNRNS